MVAPDGSEMLFINTIPHTAVLGQFKVYVEPPGPGQIKPRQVRVPAYELTYNVRYVNPGLVR